MSQDYLDWEDIPVADLPEFIEPVEAKEWEPESCEYCTEICFIEPCSVGDLQFCSSDCKDTYLLIATETLNP
jgi:hypothetical protein